MDKENMLKHVTPQDLKKFGLIPELIGRIPVLSYLNPLSREALRRILTEPKNALITQYKQLFAMDDIELEIEDDALDAMVEQAMEYKLGARGLRGICEAVLTESMYELPKKVLIQAKDVKAKLAETDGKKAA
jgi:ATP-dependent Clp protease ATP-binding subunit ClpX